MSHIFEALQRAEAERSGGNLSQAPDSVADLLEHALAKGGDRCGFGRGSEPGGSRRASGSRDTIVGSGVGADTGG